MENKAIRNVMAIPQYCACLDKLLFVEVVCPFLLPRTERQGFGPKAELEFLIY